MLRQKITLDTTSYVPLQMYVTILPVLRRVARARRPAWSPYTTRVTADIHKISSRRGTPTQHQSVVLARANATLGISLGNSKIRLKLLGRT